MSDTKFNKFKFFFEASDSLCELALLTNLTNHLNNLNLKLQRTNQTISQLVSYIDLFRRKLLLFKNYIENNIHHFYPCCQILFEEHGTNCNFKKHLYLIKSLIEQFDTHFSDFDMLRRDLILFENSLTEQIENQSLDLQTELCDLQSFSKNAIRKKYRFFF